MKFIPILATPGGPKAFPSQSWPDLTNAGQVKDAKSMAEVAVFRGPEGFLWDPPKWGMLLFLINNLRLDMFLYYNIIV